MGGNHSAEAILRVECIILEREPNKEGKNGEWTCVNCPVYPKTTLRI